ncbi:MAG: hypothetical protein IJ303_02510 [Clostridia bacterium]|nr:hypothetical protein [Clostridia bacterium]
MKKFLFALIIASLVLVASACSPKTDGNVADTGSATGSGTTADIEAPGVEKCDYTYEIIEDITTVHETEDGNKSMKILRYPKLSGLSDPEIENAVNAAFKKIAEDQYKTYMQDEEIYIIEGTFFNYSVDSVEIKRLTNSFVSVKNTVYLMTGYATYPSSPVYTVNIDLTTGEIIEEDDIFSDFNIISSKFLAGDFKKVYGADDLMRNTSFEDMILQYVGNHGAYPETYFTEDSLVINIDLVDALGTSAGFSLPFADAAEALAYNPFK